MNKLTIFNYEGKHSKNSNEGWKSLVGSKMYVQY